MKKVVNFFTHELGSFVVDLNTGEPKMNWIHISTVIYGDFAIYNFHSIPSKMSMVMILNAQCRKTVAMLIR